MEIRRNIAVIVAHTDDEIIWCGGTLLLHPRSNWFIACLCRKNNPDRAPRFDEALRAYNADGIMGDLDDSPEQMPLNKKKV